MAAGALPDHGPLFGCGELCSRVSIGVHGTTMYASLYRFDDIFLVNTHTSGAPDQQPTRNRPTEPARSRAAAPPAGPY